MPVAAVASRENTPARNPESAVREAPGLDWPVPCTARVNTSTQSPPGPVLSVGVADADGPAVSGAVVGAGAAAAGPATIAPHAAAAATAAMTAAAEWLFWMLISVKVLVLDGVE